MPPLTPAQELINLKGILAESNGIYNNTTAPSPNPNDFTESERLTLQPELFTQLEILHFLESGFVMEAMRRGVNPDNFPITLQISELKSRILSYGTEFNHLGIFFGLDTTPGTLPTVNLIMNGVKLDDSPTATIESVRIGPGSPHEFSNLNRTPTTGMADTRIAMHSMMMNRFKSNFSRPLPPSPLSGPPQDIINAAFIRLRPRPSDADPRLDIIRVLNKLESEGSSQVRISIGFYKQQDPSIPNCMHVIFRGDATGSSTFSTWDGKGYSGPKPSCPPIGCR